MDKKNRKIIRKFWHSHPPPGGNLLDIGGYNVNGVVRDCLDLKNHVPYSIDLVKHEQVEVRADAHYLPFADESFTSVWSTSTLQYLDNPFMVVAEMYRVLKPGGILYLEAVTQTSEGIIGPHWKYKDQDRWRFYPKGVRALLTHAGFSEILHCDPVRITDSTPDRVWGVAKK